MEERSEGDEDRSDEPMDGCMGSCKEGRRAERDEREYDSGGRMARMLSVRVWRMVSDE